MTLTSASRATEQTDKTAIRPFNFNFTDAEVADLRRRINATKWPERELVTDASQGVQLATMQKLARYWGTDYDWRKGEAKLKAVPHFVTEIDGLDIHFIHVRSKEKNALPIMVTRGWPGSIIEQLVGDVILVEGVGSDHTPARFAEKIRERLARTPAVSHR